MTRNRSGLSTSIITIAPIEAQRARKKLDGALFERHLHVVESFVKRLISSPCGVAVEVAQRQALHLDEQLAAQAVARALGHLHHQPDLPIGRARRRAR